MLCSIKKYFRTTKILTPYNILFTIKIDSTPLFNTFMNILDTESSDHRCGYWKYSVGSTVDFSRIAIFSFIGYWELKNNDQTYSKTVIIHP